MTPALDPELATPLFFSVCVVLLHLHHVEGVKEPNFILCLAGRL
jgi:hypothetical protein